MTIAGCAASTPDDAESDFTARVAAALGDRESTVVVARDLTGFEWQQLCFIRAEQLLLTFEGSAAATEFRFDYGTYVIDEAYVARSPADRCVGASDRLVIRRVHPRRAKTIQFQLPG